MIFLSESVCKNSIKLYLVEHFWQILCFRLVENLENCDWLEVDHPMYDVHMICYQLNIFHTSFTIHAVNKLTRYRPSAQSVAREMEPPWWTSDQ